MPSKKSPPAYPIIKANAGETYSMPPIAKADSLIETAANKPIMPEMKAIRKKYGRLKEGFLYE